MRSLITYSFVLLEQHVRQRKSCLEDNFKAHYFSYNNNRVIKLLVRFTLFRPKVKRGAISNAISSPSAVTCQWKTELYLSTKYSLHYIICKTYM